MVGIGLRGCEHGLQIRACVPDDLGFHAAEVGASLSSGQRVLAPYEQPAVCLFRCHQQNSALRALTFRPPRLHRLHFFLFFYLHKTNVFKISKQKNQRFCISSINLETQKIQKSEKYHKPVQSMSTLKLQQSMSCRLLKKRI